MSMLEGHFKIIVSSHIPDFGFYLIHTTQEAFHKAVFTARLPLLQAAL